MLIKISVKFGQNGDPRLCSKVVAAPSSPMSLDKEDIPVISEFYSVFTWVSGSEKCFLA
jgi:hypothetical protein